GVACPVSMGIAFPNALVGITSLDVPRRIARERVVKRRSHLHASPARLHPKDASRHATWTRRSESTIGSAAPDMAIDGC
ncbi:MAG TPA: hypothetical protein VGX93_04380, partial [Chthoniobacterales bacterium]|nr:hypothetical protein [Chthoniobacterales bacterium]